MTQGQRLVWKKTDRDTILHHCPDHEEIGLWYARRYTTGASYNHSETNNLIQNFKKDLSRPSKELAHKRRAISQFQIELKNFLDGRKNPKTLYLVPTPGSKSINNPLFDDRIEQVLKGLCDQASDLYYFPVLVRSVDAEATHLSNERRDPDKTYEQLSVSEEIANEYIQGSVIAIVDDVITSGSTFAACRRRIQDRFTGATVVGIFWAKAEQDDVLSVFDVLDDV